MRFRIRHTTRYAYDGPVALSHHRAHLLPRPHPRQTVHSAALSIEPGPEVRQDGVDVFGNPVSYFALQSPHLELTVQALSEITVSPPVPPEAAGTPPWETVADAAAASGHPALLEAAEFLFASPMVPRAAGLRAYAEPSFPRRRPWLEALADLTGRIHRDFAFNADATTVATPLAEVLRLRRGVCQDFAHLQIGCLRAMGLPARYVSGYLRTLPPPGQPRLVGADMSHAWISAFCPGLGWVDADPTNDRLVADEHITLAWGRDYDDVSPLRGVILGGGDSHNLAVEVDVLPLDPL